MKSWPVLLILLSTLLSASCGLAQSGNKYSNPKVIDYKTVFPLNLSESEWKKRLSPQQYHILRKKGTEPAVTGKYDHFYEKGTYYSAASLQPVFSSETKYNSKTGW